MKKEKIKQSLLVVAPFERVPISLNVVSGSRTSESEVFFCFDTPSCTTPSLVEDLVSIFKSELTGGYSGLSDLKFTFRFFTDWPGDSSGISNVKCVVLENMVDFSNLRRYLEIMFPSFERKRVEDNIMTCYQNMLLVINIKERVVSLGYQYNEGFNRFLHYNMNTDNYVNF